MALLALAANAANAAVRFDQRALLLGAPVQTGALLGRAAVDGDIAVAGAPGEDGNAGAVHVFERFRGGFAFRQRLVASDRVAGDSFGSAIDVDDDTIAVGATGADGIGAVYVFTRDGAGVWGQRQRLVGDRREAGDQFGSAVALDGDDLIVGAPNLDTTIIFADSGKRLARAKGNITDVGAAFHFARRNGTYAQLDNAFFAPDFRSNGFFGISVAIDRNRFVVGSFFGNGAVASSGSAYVYSRASPAASWTGPQEIFAPDGDASDVFSRVTIQGDIVVVGAPGDDTSTITDHGAAYVFRLVGASFSFAQKLLPQVLAGTTSFGNSVSISGSVLAVGASSSAYVDVLENSGGSFAFRQQLPGQGFGTFMGLSDNALVVGTPGRDAPGATAAGALFVFERDEPSRLSRQRRFTTSAESFGDRGRFDLLGSSVAINDRWLVAGAPGVVRYQVESDGFFTTGAAYVFDRLQPGAPAVLGAAGLDDGDRFGQAVAISRDGSTVAVGAPEAGFGSPGELFVYTRPGAAWTGTLTSAARIAISVACGSRDGFARAVAIGDDGLILVGSPLNTYGALGSVGAAYVLRPNGSGYDQFCIAAPNAAASGQFGAEVAVEGRHLYIGAPDESRVYHYEMTPTGPVFRHVLAGQTVSSDAVVAHAKGITGNKFGAGIDAAGDTIVVGAPLADTAAGADAGMAYVYEIDGTTIDATAELIGDKFGAGANAGASVATNGDVVVLGAPLADSGGVVDSGGAYAYEKPESGWAGTQSEDGALDPPEQNAGGLFGFDVAATDDAVAIGEPYDDGPTIDGIVADDQGSAFAFDFTELLLADGFE